MARPMAVATATSLIAVSMTVTVWVARRAVRVLRALRSANHQHAAAARVVGKPTQWRNVVVLDADHPAAYCVAGQPRAIVVTSAALASLQNDQLAAVLAHEQAHLSGRHHQILMLLRAAGSALPAVPLAATGPASVARLLEMCADDSAVRRHGSHPLLCGLMALVASPAAPAAALGAAGIAVLDRASRLAAPAPRGARWRDRVRLCTTIGLTIAAPLFTGFICHH